MFRVGLDKTADGVFIFIYAEKLEKHIAGRRIITGCIATLYLLRRVDLLLL